MKDMMVQLLMKVKKDLARELARMNLTLNTYTQWYWKTDLIKSD
jgi:thymidylate synthase (FAD)